MTTLVIVRHAAAEGGRPGLPDHERPLSERGRHDAPRMARRLAERGFRPGRILSSTAERARSTAAAFAAELGGRVELLPELYGADPETLLEVAATSDADEVLLVAHDPGVSALAYELSEEIGHLPTCAVATFTWDADDPDAMASTRPASWHLDVPR